MEGAILITSSHFTCCLSSLLGYLSANHFDSSPNSAVGGGVSGVAQRCWIGFAWRPPAWAWFSLPACWTSVHRSAKAFKWTRLFWRDAQVLFSCFLPSTSYILLEVNFHSGYKLRHKGSTCNFLSASFFYLKNSSCNAILVFSHLNNSLIYCWVILAELRRQLTCSLNIYCKL